MHAIMMALMGTLLFCGAPRSTSMHEHGGHGEMGQGATRGTLGSYPMSREASGTSWQPDSSIMEGIHKTCGATTGVAHGFATLIYDRQEGPRGNTKIFSSNMVMLMVQRPLLAGTGAFRAMFSLEPYTAGGDGYPLLLQTGETSDGKTPLIDRQHPHDLFMELGALYSIPVTEESSLFFYGALPGEPALGPPAYLHRFSGMSIPDAPLLHHWLDSTHITFGVATLGYVFKNVKLEGSLFKGREPDENRQDIETPKLDSWSARFSVNPSSDWALQASYGYLVSPEQLEPSENIYRYTFSAIHNSREIDNNAQTTFAWGRNDTHGLGLDGILLEHSVRVNKTTVFARAESVEKDELLQLNTPALDDVYLVHKIGAGLIYDFAAWGLSRWGIGGSLAANIVPDGLKPFYGDLPLSAMVFTRLKL